jgi:hypothetical protein
VDSTDVIPLDGAQHNERQHSGTDRGTDRQTSGIVEHYTIVQFLFHKFIYF